MNGQGIALPADVSSLLASRRRALRDAGGITLSAAAVALLGGRPALAAGQASHAEGDVRILNGALGAEHQAVAAYQLGADSGLLGAAIKAVALQFQSHHKAHADLLAATVRKLGGQPVEPKAAYDFPLATLKSQDDVLRFAAGLEQGAVSAYVGAVPTFADRALAQAAASILGDEAMHWAVLRQVLGESPAVPHAFVS